jgi:predicted secreted hydrolase
MRASRVASLCIAIAFVASLPIGTTASPSKVIRSSAAPLTCGSRDRGLAPRRFIFPRDNGAHDAYPEEWWRTFGRVSDAAGDRFDFSVNVSRFALATDASNVGTTGNRWSARGIVTTSYEFLNEQTLEVKRGTFVDRQSRIGAKIADDGLSIVARGLTYSEVSQSRSRARHFALSVRDAGDANAISVVQSPTNAALPLGPGGVMQTGSCLSNAAYAYAYTRNATRGVLRFDGVDHRVSGSTWVEHEFADRELSARDAGWDRFEVQFDDGRDVDARFARDAVGNVVATAGVYVAADGDVTYLTPGSAGTMLPPEAHERDAQWHSNQSDLTYPAMWFFIVKPGRLALATVELTHDQELRAPGRTPYYWGAIAVEKYGPPGGDRGHGFVELTGYAGTRNL